MSARFERMCREIDKEVDEEMSAEAWDNFLSFTFCAILCPIETFKLLRRSALADLDKHREERK